MKVTLMDSPQNGEDSLLSLHNKWIFYYHDWVTTNLVAGQRDSIETVKQCGLLSVRKKRLLSTNQQQHPIAEDSIYTTHRMWKDQTGSYIELSHLYSTVIHTERYSEGYQKKHVITNPTANLFLYSVLLPAKFARSMMEKSVWKKLTTTYLT